MESFKLHPLQIDGVIDIIKKFVHDPETLRSCRRVNSVWLKCVNRNALQQSTFVGLERIAFAAPESLGFSSVTLEEEEESAGWNIQRLKVKDQAELLQHENVVKYFVNSGNQLRFISFEAAKNKQMSLLYVQFLNNVLYKWCSELEELELVGLIENDFTDPLQAQVVKNILLKKLVMNYAETLLPSHDMVTPVVQNMIECAKDLDSFVLIGHEYDLRISSFSHQIMRLMSDVTRNLTSLEFFNASIGSEELTLMTTTGWALNKVIIDGSLFWDVKVSHLNLFLEAQSKSLKYFHLRVKNNFSDDASELRIHTLQNLEVLKIVVQRIKVGSSGLLGKLEKLHHLTLWGKYARVNSERLNFETMFANKVSSSIKTLCLDDAYASEVSSLPKWCPVVSELNIDVSENTIKDFLLNLNEMLDNRNTIEDLKVTVNFNDFVENDELMKRLVIGVCRLKLRTLKIVAVYQNHDFPCIRSAWIGSGLIKNYNTFFRFVLEGFYIRDDEISAIANVLTERSNFTTWIDCKAIAMFTGKVIHLKEENFFRDNVKALSKKILKSVRENA